MNKSQIIVAIEGIDGAGKTTLINAICRYYSGESIVYNRTSKGIFFDKLVSSAIMQKHYMLQVPIYLLLSYKNYILFKTINKNKNKVIIMDRCFLSTICYFYPKALKNDRLLKKLLFLKLNYCRKKFLYLMWILKRGKLET